MHEKIHEKPVSLLYQKNCCLGYAIANADDAQKETDANAKTLKGTLQLTSASTVTRGEEAKVSVALERILLPLLAAMHWCSSIFDTTVGVAAACGMLRHIQLGEQGAHT